MSAGNEWANDSDRPKRCWGCWSTAAVMGALVSLALGLLRGGRRG